jgi:hypothetical protein
MVDAAITFPFYNRAAGGIDMEAVDWLFSFTRLSPSQWRSARNTDALDKRFGLRVATFGAILPSGLARSCELLHARFLEGTYGDVVRKRRSRRRAFKRACKGIGPFPNSIGSAPLIEWQFSRGISTA